MTAGRWRSWRGWGAVTTLAIALLAGAASAQTPDDVLLTAEQVTYNEELGVVTASGNVELSRGVRVLRADTLSYNRRADLVTASGNVALIEPSGDVLFADYMELTGDLKSGAIAGIRILMTDESRLGTGLFVALLVGWRSVEQSHPIYLAHRVPRQHRDGNQSHDDND